MISDYPLEVLDRSLQHVESYFMHALSDANSETRQSARKAFLIWELKHPHSAKKISNLLDISV